MKNTHNARLPDAVIRLVFCLLALTAGVFFISPESMAAGGKITPEARFKTLRAQFDSLKGDAKKGTLRDNWLKLEKSWNALQKEARGDTQAWAAYMKGRTREELSARSYNRTDMETAADHYAQAAKSHPKHSLADDCLYRQAYVLGLGLGRENDAVKVLDGLIKRYPKGDQIAKAKELRDRLNAPASARTGQAGQAQRPDGGGNSGRRPGKPASDDLLSQLGLTVETIMIDAGHGGKDPGAQANKITEKNTALKMALLLGDELKKKGFTVIYTRKNNIFIPLEKRAQMSNEKKADLFISIHCNANNSSKVNGFETYYLSPAKSNDAVTVAARENGISTKEISDLQYILADLMLDSKLKESRQLASYTHKGTLARLKKAGFTHKDNGVRAAPFYVLMGARMPAVLVELGYITNDDDAKRIKSDKFLQRVAEGLTQGIINYKSALSSMPGKR